MKDERSKSMPTIALLTDFGLQDTYVGVMKGVIRTIAPNAVVVTTDDTAYTFVLPDNGLLTPILNESDMVQVVVLDNPRYHLSNVSHTFHGRDIFAPVAAHLAAGVSISEVGTPLPPNELVRLEWPHPQPSHFGNLITNLRAEDLLPDLRNWLIAIGIVQIQGISRTFGDVAPGMPVAYIGSSGFLELAVRQGNARRQWGIGPGAMVRVVRIPPSH